LKRIIIDRKSGKIVNEKKIKRKRTWILLIALSVTGVLSTLSDFHLDKILGIDYSVGFDMLQHGGYYFVLVLVLLYYLPTERRSGSLFMFLFSFSVIFEAMQLLVPGRTFSELDILSNLLGITAGFIVNNVYHNYRGK
jgi:glycopeptide antibiotics resistance protein